MLVVEGLCAGYGEVNVLSDVNIEVGQNESVAIVGANGAGKSTLVSAICGLVPARRGRVVKDGQPIHGLPAHRRAEIGIAVVLENRHLFGELSVRQNLELALNSGRTRKSAGVQFGLQDVLELFPFMKERVDSAVDLLSGGEQQMVAIGRALLLKPDLLILDEPSTGLAPKVVKDIVAVVAGLRKRGMSLILVEQNVSIAEQNSDRAYVMSLGRVVKHVERGGWSEFARSDSLVKAYLG
jgi:branched-chain amino acid transport system ATP-binding protein/nonpolar-amino-acid-transporting ATPase